MILFLVARDVAKTNNTSFSAKITRSLIEYMLRVRAVANMALFRGKSLPPDFPISVGTTRMMNNAHLLTPLRSTILVRC